MGLTKIPDGQLRILPLPKKEFFGYRQHYKPNPLQECNLPNKIEPGDLRYRRYISVWNDDKKEWQTLACNDALYKALQEASDKLKKESGSYQTPIVVIKEGDGTSG